jgi:hypothetical protein
MPRLRVLAPAAALAVTAAAIASPAGGHQTAASAAASGFTTRIDNPWFPLRPGTALIYRGVKDGRRQRGVFAITHRTRVVGGVRCVVILDRTFVAGRLVERTTDYYAQDRRGNVWYFGEDTAELDGHGHVVSREGTWHAGRDGAGPGLFMPAHPRVGEHHLQEHYRGHAEDQYRIVSLRARISVPFGSFRGALRTREWTDLEPGVREAKYYVRGIGEVYEGSLRGPEEHTALVRVRR